MSIYEKKSIQKDQPYGTKFSVYIVYMPTRTVLLSTQTYSLAAFIATVTYMHVSSCQQSCMVVCTSLQSPPRHQHVGAFDWS